MTRLWTDGKPITVETTEHGKPLQLTLDGKVHLVDLICNRYRSAGNWWEGESDREYIKLATETGMLCLIAKDIDDDQWLLIRLYD